MKSDGRFICILPPKALDLHGGAHRECNDAKVARRLSQFHLNSQVWLSDGGGVAVSTPSAATKTLVRPEVFVNDTLIVAFCGYLTNLEELTTKMLYKELCEVGYLPERNLSARVVGMLYAKTHDPSQVVAKLRGTFSFAVLDTESVRVFAARDNSGSMPLFQGRLPDGTLVVSNFTPEGLEMEEEVPSGHYIFGNRRANVSHKFSPALDELQQATTHAHSAACHALEGLCAKRKPLVLDPRAVSFTEVVSRAQKRKAFAKGRTETALLTIRRDSSGNIRCDSGNIRCDSGNIRCDSGNRKVKTSLPPPVKARVLFQKDIPAVTPLVARLRNEKKRPDTPRRPRETDINAAVSQLPSMVISAEDHCFGSRFAFSPPRVNTREKKGRRMANIYTKDGADGSSWWRKKVDCVAPFLQEPALAPGPVSPPKEEDEKVEKGMQEVEKKMEKEEEEKVEKKMEKEEEEKVEKKMEKEEEEKVEKGIEKVEKGMEEVEKEMGKEEEEEEEVEKMEKKEKKVEIPQKEQIELAVRMLHKIASSGKIQIMLQQNEEYLGSPRGPIKVPSCSNLSRACILRVSSLDTLQVPSCSTLSRACMLRVSSMQRVGSDLQSLVGEV
eukprot:CAMPEP_0198229728 /NCGR_PEP_ID=MMETSP1445-20131203/114274_1 /TAXON_ID=36898 /ORGANISM="Pyramimonas sp., Strain CCMP2087" /LENGTH=610 /DNA_ID=CAMNT_0043910201 /DNA_START=287 /DNA_END=2119 /DNA_ORIENTATION=+